MKFKVGDIVMSPDGKGEILSLIRNFWKNETYACLDLIPRMIGYTPSFQVHQLRSIEDVNDILKEIL